MTDEAQLRLDGEEVPLHDLDLSPNLRLLAERERQLVDPLTPMEAGAILHAHRGKHPESTPCADWPRRWLVGAETPPRSAGTTVSRRLAPAIPLDEIDEKTWDAQLFATRTGLASTLGWRLRYHTLRSKGSTSGFPDRVLVRERVIFAELKTETGKPTDSQQQWLTGLAAAGAEVYLWRPSDLEEIGKVLAQRGDPWWPRASLWLPGGCRNDENKPLTIDV